MKHIANFTAVAVTAMLLLAATPIRAELNDPFQILNKYYEKMGGLDVLKAQKSSHVEGTIVIVGTGMEGTFVEWAQAPNRKRQDVDLTIFKQQSGDNGQYPWTVDPNGKLQIVRDETRLKDRKVDSLLAEFDHLNRNSTNFSVAYKGTDTADGATCYVVQITNSINIDTLLQYFDTTTFLMVEQVSKKPDGEGHAHFSDYRKVDNILMSFKQEILLLPTGMKQVVQLTSVELNIPVDLKVFEPPTADVQDFRFANGKSVENVPFEFIDGHIYLPVEVGGRVRLWVLDTGASVTVVEKKFADELGLKREGNIKGQGAGNIVDVSFTTLPAFSIPGLEFDSQRVAVIDINRLFRQWIGQDVAGILGCDFLSRLAMKIDYANEKLSFYHPDSFQYTGSGTVIDAPLSSSTTFELPITVEGKYSGKWDLDLGAGGMSFLYPFARENGFFERPGVDRMGFGAGGSYPNRAVRFSTLEFAGHTITDPVISMPREEVKGAFANKELVGNIGNTLLRRFVLYLDYKREQVIVEKGDDFDRPVPVDNSGLQVMNNDDDQLEVFFISDGTPGAKAGFQAGDIIRSINGIDVKYIGGVVALKELLEEAPGTKYTFAVTRAGQEKAINLTLKDIYR